MSNPHTHPNVSDEARFQAVIARDEAADGRFFYGVVTTGIYCRPSCASRAPLRKNVRFFGTVSEAIDAGFRACKRCRPGASPGEAERLERMAAVARWIEAHADEALPLATLAERAGVSPGFLQRTFKAVFGASPKAFHDAARLGRLKGALREGGGVTDAILKAGHGSPSRVYGRAQARLGMTPKAYRDGAEGEAMSYAYRESSLGPLMMAATDRGVCFVMFGADEPELLAALVAEFPRAQVAPMASVSSGELDAWMDALDAHLAHAAPLPEIPLDLRGTAFQLRVWSFLLSIPTDATVSYREVAEGIGQGAATRAAATACGRNRVAVLVPCHRVLRANGGLGGYRWGEERKAALLARLAGSKG